MLRLLRSARGPADVAAMEGAGSVDRSQFGDGTYQMTAYFHTGIASSSVSIRLTPVTRLRKLAERALSN